MPTGARPRLSFDLRLEPGPGATFALGLTSLAQVTNADSGRRAGPLSASPEYSRAACLVSAPSRRRREAAEP
jgi:hypothetical protein